MVSFRNLEIFAICRPADHLIPIRGIMGVLASLRGPGDSLALRFFVQKRLPGEERASSICTFQATFTNLSSLRLCRRSW